MTFMETTQVRDLAIIMKHITAMHIELGQEHEKDRIPGSDSPVGWGDGFWLDYSIEIKTDDGQELGEIQFEDDMVRFQGK